MPVMQVYLPLDVLDTIRTKAQEAGLSPSKLLQRLVLQSLGDAREIKPGRPRRRPEKDEIASFMEKAQAIREAS